MKSEILVLVKDNFVRAAIERHCSSYAPAVAVATIGDALRAVNRNKLAAAILDLHWAGESALAVLKKIRQNETELPVLMLAGHLTDEASRRARELGADLLFSFEGTARLDAFLSGAVGN